MKSVQIWSFFWSVFSLLKTESGKIRTRKTPYLDNIHVVYNNEYSKHIPKKTDLKPIRVELVIGNFNMDLFLTLIATCLNVK